MHLLGDAACVVSSCVFVTIYLNVGQSGPQISRKSSVPRAFYVEPRVPIWSTDLADVAAVGGSLGQQFLVCHSAGPL
jgi:hypothetical protein